MAGIISTQWDHLCPELVRKKQIKAISYCAQVPPRNATQWDTPVNHCVGSHSLRSCPCQRAWVLATKIVQQEGLQLPWGRWHVGVIREGKVLTLYDYVIHANDESMKLDEVGLNVVAIIEAPVGTVFLGKKATPETDDRHPWSDVA